MTFGRYEDKDGSGSLSAGTIVSSGIEPEVGKRTRAEGLPPQPEQHMTGFKTPDQGFACDNKPLDGTDCFLTPERRMLLYIEFRDGVARTREAYNQACTLVELKIFLERHENSNPLIAFAVSMLTGFLIGRLGDAVVEAAHSVKIDPFLAVASKANASHLGVSSPTSDALRTKALQSAESSMGPSLKERALLAVQGMDKTKLELKLEGAIDKAKEVPVKQTEKAGERQLKTKQQSDSGYVEVLRSFGERAFDEATQLAAGVTDAELESLAKLFKIDGKTTNDFVAAIEDKLELYRNSGITDLGRHQTLDVLSKTQRGEVTSAVSANHDVRVQWRNYYSGHPRELVFIHRHSQGGKHDKSQGPSMLGTHDGPGAPRVIDPTLWNDAISQHTAIWGVPPENIDIDDSDSDDPRRAMAAKNQKYKLAQAGAASDRAANLAKSQQQEMDRQKYVRPTPLVAKPKTILERED